MQVILQANLKPEYANLLARAREVSENAYNKYSGFFVGVALLSTTGEVYSGTFFENASNPVGVCAERVAIGAAVTAGCRAYEALAVVGGPSTSYSGDPVTPCGLCRQSLSEFATIEGQDVLVFCSNMTLSTIWQTDSRQLLPDAFFRD